MLINGTIRFTKHELECIDQAFLYLTKMYPEFITADKLAAEVNIDTKTLQAGFRKQTGLTIHNYQLRKRIEQAISDLENIDLPIKQITFKNGFKSSSQFGKAFKKITGKTPMEYRLQIID